MNQSIHIVPWRSRSEFNQVRDWFFGSSKNQESLVKGLSRVNAWQVRGRIPHAVEATANLICVMVQEERGTCDPLGLRLSYAMALTRFVNGFLDPEQQGQYVIPMQTLARNIDLPLSFVEIRHASTHEQLPSLVMLRSMAIRALEWLLDKYWTRSSENSIDLNKKTMEKRIEDILNKWEAHQEKNFNITSKNKDEDNKEASEMIKECIILCSSYDGIEIMTNQLLKKIIKLPKNMSKDLFFSKTYAIWLPFIKRVSSSVSNLVQHFISQIILKLGSTDEKTNYTMNPLPILSFSASKKKDIDTSLHDILLLWLQNILNRKYPNDNSIKPLFPEFTVELLKNIASSNKHILKLYEPFISLRTNINSRPNSLKTKRSLEQIADEIDTFRKRVQTLSTQNSSKYSSVDENNNSVLILANGLRLYLSDDVFNEAFHETFQVFKEDDFYSLPERSDTLADNTAEIRLKLPSDTYSTASTNISCNKSLIQELPRKKPIIVRPQESLYSIKPITCFFPGETAINRVVKITLKSTEIYT
ncbi:hypothetical protein PORY_000021 [Pneumocystis oryctolagi]|uniref:Uncharacterized protein n=1 Tax=Pneumocystis oryctolagi TaxID=42067 RepID=A0ACB7CG67_9ASCO|nr:hypothetical protein PORY_000021 [Pneumocystis oryctolagi]